MHTRRDWLRSSLGIGGLLLAPPSILSAQEKSDFQPRSLDPVIRLSSNENPYGPSNRVQERIKNSFIHGCRYPYAYSDNLAEQLAIKHGVSPESIIITGGSTEGLRITGLTFASNGGEIIGAEHTKGKGSDRIIKTCELLNAFSINCKQKKDGIKLY